MSSLNSNLKFITVVKKMDAKCNIIFLSLMLMSSVCQAADLEPRTYGDFKTYTLALSWAPGFCQSQHDAKKPEKPQCVNRPSLDSKVDYLTIHGLWASLPDSISKNLNGSYNDKNKQWFSNGCQLADVAQDTPPANQCQLGMPTSFLNTLLPYMPGAAQGDCLAQHEYSKHGSCFQFEPITYFGKMIDLDKQVRESEFGGYLANNYGQKVSRDELLARAHTSFGEKAMRSLKLSCSGRGDSQYLVEIQFPIWKDAVNKKLDDSSFPDSDGSTKGNCPDSFWIDEVGY